jgi:hypothetical protein
MTTNQSDGWFFGSLILTLVLAFWKAIELIGWFLHTAFTHYWR